MDTIAAIATAPGESAIGIIRMSGNRSVEIITSLMKKKDLKESVCFIPWKMHYGYIVENEKIIDEVLAVLFKGPKSYTQEDMVEIHCHGGALSLKRVLEALLRRGVRIAEPGEFTKRAFLNGRLDLTQAESVMDLIQSKTDAALQEAVGQLNGKLSDKIDSIREQLGTMLAHLTVNLDYPEEDIEEITYEEIKEGCNEALIEVRALLKKSESGKIIREGLKIALIGRPNVGKSSLMNALLQEERAIVTEIPGTTRDVIEEYLNIKGIPARLMDTAGVRDTDDLVEKIGVEKTKERYQQADLVLTVLNVSEGITKEDIDILEQVKDKKVIVILNKSDLDSKVDEEHLRNIVPNMAVIRTSIVTELGLEALEDAIYELVYQGQVHKGSPTYITNARHIVLLEVAESFLKDILKAIVENMPYDFIEMDLRSAFNTLGEITGDTVKDDLLDKIFGQFCLGK